MKLVSRDGDDGVADVSGVKRRVRLDLVPEAGVGDYIIVHAGYAIQRLEEEEAQYILKTLGDYFAAAEGEGAPV